MMMKMRQNCVAFWTNSSENWQIGEKASTNIPLKKIYYLRKMEKITCPYGPMYLPLDEYPPYSDKNPTSLRQTLTNNSDVFMDIQIMINRMYWLLGFQ